ncbi:11550_t:CDS:1, partial [Acaulospora morrowiae]
METSSRDLKSDLGLWLSSVCHEDTPSPVRTAIPARQTFTDMHIANLGLFTVYDDELLSYCHKIMHAYLMSLFLDARIA